MAKANIEPAILRLNDILPYSLTITSVRFAMGSAFVPSSFFSKVIAILVIVAYSPIADSLGLILWLKNKQRESKRDEEEMGEERERSPVAVEITELGVIKLVVSVVFTII